MILIDDILVSRELVEEYFACQLSACKGACCYEGDYGAPLDEGELEVIERDFEKIKNFIPEESLAVIDRDGFYNYSKSRKVYETGLMPDASCVFMGKDSLGITYCSIEKAYAKGVTDFKKPISCHLYPVRILENRESGFTALNYDRWDICQSACANGLSSKIKIYEFVKEALIRKYGDAFYEELNAAAEELKRSDPD